MTNRAMIPGKAHPMCLRLPALGLTAALFLARAGVAVAFPLLDSVNPDQVPLGTELSSPDAQDLRHQLGLVNGLSAPAGGGWTFAPRVDWQEELTDNAEQLHSPRKADLVTFVSPGIGIAGDMPRVQMTFDFAPTVSEYARTSNLNSLTYQMNGLASVTVVPNLAFVDVRAVAGVHSLYGGLGGFGSTAGSATALPQAGVPTLAGNGLGLNKADEVQTFSYGISPYVLGRFGDWGTGRVGYSLDVTQSDQLSGFTVSPIPAGGASAQTLVTNQESAHFVTGDVLEYVQDTFDATLQQSQTISGANVTDPQTGLPLTSHQNSTSTRAIITDQINYQVDRTIALFVSGGHEDIHYTGFGAQSINDLTWSLGTTLTPNADSQLTVSYGHQDGFNSLSASGHYALTARTLLSVSYGSTLGSQLEGVQNQLNQAASNGSGALVNGQTGGQLFAATNALGVQTGIFKTTTLSAGTQTTLDRDILSLNLSMSHQTSTGTAASSSADTKSVSLGWLHEMRPDMTVSATVSYALQDQSSGLTNALNPGNNTSIAANLAWQWQISDTLTGSVRYSFFERQSPVSAYQLYENMLILGVSKRF